MNTPTIDQLATDCTWLALIIDECNLPDMAEGSAEKRIGHVSFEFAYPSRPLDRWQAIAFVSTPETEPKIYAKAGGGGTWSALVALFKILWEEAGKCDESQRNIAASSAKALGLIETKDGDK
jgi:hypothetical protein